MFLSFQKIAPDVSYGFGRNRSMFLIDVFLKKLSENISKSLIKAQKRNMFLRFQKIALYVSYGLG